MAMLRYRYTSSTIRPALKQQRGLTLVELMVALALGLLIVLTAAGALVLARQGFTSVDSTSQLRENARFAADVIQRLAVQAAFEDVSNGSSRRPDDPKDPGIQGYDNAWVDAAWSTEPSYLANLVNGSRPGSACPATDTSCRNGGDVLMVRFWGASDAAGNADGTMINCAGIPEPRRAAIRSYAVFHLSRTADGEPALACSYLDGADKWQTQALVKGVEGLQVLYGVDHVTPFSAPPASSSQMDGVPDQYLTATQMVVAGDPEQTLNNWRRVRSLRIGLLFRGDVGSAIDKGPSTGADWNVLDTNLPANGDDVGSTLHVAADSRLRQRLVLTVHLRNQQGYDLNLAKIP